MIHIRDLWMTYATAHGHDKGQAAAVRGLSLEIAEGAFYTLLGPSGGQQQRLALARALVAEPRVLLLDEPLSNLDAKLREQMRLELREMVERLKVTTLFVTHEQIEALTMSDTVAVMKDGVIVQAG